MIPFSPPFIDDDVVNEVVDALRSGWITTGKRVRELEEQTAVFCGVENVVAVNSATSALMLALHWFGVGKGDEVIVPAYTYCATALAVMH
ncbi:MAG TPA: DegT/DnrJ/EryC1/StrS family aminotransferase, partial [Chitinophagaceae bacterium]|nr:DegT/DnrJ/EryC1/StrS family aminotransferase [Chitinophagaceae bacterium]